MGWQKQNIGHGIGLRLQHFAHILECGVDGVDWFEIISENFFEDGGRPWAVLERVRRDKPVVMHGVGLAVGNSEGLSSAYLEKLRTVIKRVQPAWVSDHLCWGGYGGHHAHDLLPVPYTQECVDLIVKHVNQVQDFLGQQFMLENPSTYVAFTESHMPEWEFLGEIVRRTNCGLLLDVNNVIVSAYNHHFSAKEYIENIPVDCVGQLHLAGHTDKKTFLFDSHVGPVPDVVWSLYRDVLKRFGSIPALVEWDEDVPAYEIVVAESQKARRIENEVLHGAR